MLLAGLPPLVRVNVRGSNAGIWLEASLRSNAPLARIAEEVGYQTDTAFSREFGSPPATWRRSQSTLRQVL